MRCQAEYKSRNDVIGRGKWSDIYKNINKLIFKYINLSANVNSSNYHEY